MTWKQFKAEAEAKGITDDMDIWFIDVVFPVPDQLAVIPPHQHPERSSEILGLTTTD